MLFTVYGNPDSGKTTFCRHLAEKFGKTLILINEGTIQSKAHETVVPMPMNVEPLAWFKSKWDAVPQERKDEYKCIFFDSLTGVNDAYQAPALIRCLQDEKLKNKSQKEKEQMTLSGVPFGMGEAVRAELVKGFIHFLAELSRTHTVIVSAHTQILTVVSSDQAQNDIVSIGVGGKSEKAAASRNALMQHSDVIVYCDSTPEREGARNIPARRIVVGASGLLVTKYKATMFNKDEFFSPADFYDIKGKDALLKTISDLF